MACESLHAGEIDNWSNFLRESENQLSSTPYLLEKMDQPDYV